MNYSNNPYNRQYHNKRRLQSQQVQPSQKTTKKEILKNYLIKFIFPLPAFWVSRQCVRVRVGHPHGRPECNWFYFTHSRSIYRKNSQQQQQTPPTFVIPKQFQSVRTQMQRCQIWFRSAYYLSNITKGVKWNEKATLTNVLKWMCTRRVLILCIYIF